MTSTPLPAGLPNRPVLLRRRPALAGLASAVLLFFTSSDSEGLAITVVIAALCYLGAAALDRRWVAWVGIPVGGALVTASRLADFPWWAALGLAAAALVVVGLAAGAAARAVTPQAIALVAYGGVALVATFLDPRAGLLPAGVVLTLHGVWDVIHYRRDVVVSRALSEFCVLLDVPLGAGCIVLALLG